jgi:hypothetical protein
VRLNLNKILYTKYDAKILWHVDPLLGNVHETNNWTTARKTATEERCLPCCQYRDVISRTLREEFSQSVELVELTHLVCELGGSVTELLRFGPCELLLLEAGS